MIDLVRNIVVIVLLTTFLDLLLPSNSMRGFVKAIMGLFILVSILNPFLNIIMGCEDFEVFAWHQDNFIAEDNSILVKGERLQNVNQELFLKNYAQRIELQMQALLQLIQGIEEVKVQVTLQENTKNAQHQIKEVQVSVLSSEREEEDEEDRVSRSVDPVKIELEESLEKKREEEELQQFNNRINEQIYATLCQYFGLEQKQIKVVFSQ